MNVEPQLSMLYHRQKSETFGDVQIEIKSDLNQHAIIMKGMKYWGCLPLSVRLVYHEPQES